MPMQRSLAILLTLLAFVCPTFTWGAAGFCSALEVSGNPEYPPLLWRDRRNPERLIGAAVELLEQAVADRGIKVNSRYVGPWSRAQAEAKSGRLDMLTGAFITDERQTWMDYIHPAMMVMPSVIFVNKNDAFPMDSWDDLKGRLGDTLINNSFGQEFDTYAKRELRIEVVRSIEFAFERLLLRRSDYVIYELFQGQAIAEVMGINDRIMALDTIISSEGLYFTLSKKSACNTPAFRDYLDQKIARLVADHVPERLVATYLQVWKGQATLPAHE